MAAESGAGIPAAMLVGAKGKKKVHTGKVSKAGLGLGNGEGSHLMPKVPIPESSHYNRKLPSLCRLRQVL